MYSGNLKKAKAAERFGQEWRFFDVCRKHAAEEHMHAKEAGAAADALARKARGLVIVESLLHSDSTALNSRDSDYTFYLSQLNRHEG